MPDLPGESIRSVNQFSVRNDAASKTGAQSDQDKILHAPGGAEKHFSERGGVGVIGDRNGNLVIFSHLPLYIDIIPVQVGRLLNGVFVEVGVGRPDSYARQLAFFLYAVQELFCILLKLVEKLFCGLMRIGFRRRAGQAFSLPVYIPDFSIGASNIDSQYNLQFRHGLYPFLMPAPGAGALVTINLDILRHVFPETVKKRPQKRHFY